MTDEELEAEEIKKADAEIKKAEAELQKNQKKIE